MAERERFVPRRVGRLTVELCELDHGWGHAGGGPAQFRTLSRLVAAFLHHELHDREQAVTDAWDDVDDSPDAADLVESELSTMLDAANYTPVTLDELQEALDRESLIPLRFDVHLDCYDKLLVARRGSHKEIVEVPRWRGLRTLQRTITVDERVVVHARLKPATSSAERGVTSGDRSSKPGNLSLKQFQNVPRADIEMLLPATKVRFRPIDTLMLGVPAVASGIAVLATKLAPTIGLMVLLVAAWLGLREEAPQLDQTSLVVLLGGAMTVGGFLVRQWTKLKDRRARYLKTLSENLYFRTLGDGPGVIHTLLAAIEQQEVIETLLAYRFLLPAGDGLTAEELDRRVETWLHGAGDDVDFEVHDALAKLDRLGLVERRRGELVRAVPLDEALARLDRRWDDLFRCASDLAPEAPRGASAGHV